MRKSFLIIIITCFCIQGISQNIVDFFEMLPSKSILGLSIAERKDIVKYSIDNKNTDDAYNDLKTNNIDFAFDTVDIRGAYLSLIGGLDGTFTMCYWNLTNGNKLIAIYMETCGPVCMIEQFDFYEYNGANFKHIDWHDIIPRVYTDFFGQNYKSKIRELNDKDILATLLFILPRKGKNIIAKWGNEETTETYKKYALGNRMKLIWDDGKFIKGDIYWKYN